MSIGYMLKYSIPNAVTSITDLELDVLRVLKDRRQTPRNISKILRKSDSQILHILRSLKDKGIVTSEKGEGRNVYYTIKKEHSWIGDAIECVDKLTELDNKAVTQILSDDKLNGQRKKLAMRYYFKMRDKELEKLVRESFEKAVALARASSL